MSTDPLGVRDRLRKILAPPTFEADEEQALLASLLHPILLSVLFGVVLYALIAPVHRDTSADRVESLG